MTSLDISSVDPGWIAGLGVELGLEGLPRTDRLQMRIMRLPEIGWRIVHLLAPLDHGLWFVKAYAPYAASVNRLLEPAFDPTLPDRFKRQLRKLGVGLRTERAELCFGIRPSALHGTFFTRGASDARMFGRYHSFFAPESCGDALVSYFEQQIRQFGDAAVAPAEDHALLWNHLLPDDEDMMLMCGSPPHLPPGRASWVLQRLESILSSDAALRDFERDLGAAMKFSGAIRLAPVPVLGDGEPRPGDDIERRILVLRLRLAQRLGWPHLLESGITAWVWSGATDDHGLRSTLETQLHGAFPVTAQDPLAGCG